MVLFYVLDYVAYGMHGNNNGKINNLMKSRYKSKVTITERSKEIYNHLKVDFKQFCVTVVMTDITHSLVVDIKSVFENIFAV